MFRSGMLLMIIGRELGTAGTKHLHHALLQGLDKCIANHCWKQMRLSLGDLSFFCQLSIRGRLWQNGTQSEDNIWCSLNISYFNALLS